MNCQKPAAFAGEYALGLSEFLHTCQIEHILRNAVSLEYLGYFRKITVRTLNYQHRRAVSIDYARQFAVEAFMAVDRVEIYLLAAKSDSRRYLR